MLLQVGRLLKVEVESIEEAQERFATLRDEGNDGFGYGSRELGLGRVYDDHGEKLGTISYNGRFWSI